MKKNIFVITMVLAWGVVCVGQSFAQLIVEEGKIKKEVHPGETLTGTITLHNSTNAGIDAVAYLEDFEYVLPFDGSKKFFPAGTVEKSAADWITFQPKQIHLPAHNKKKVNYTISVPQDASGGYYSVLFFERSDRQHITQGQVGLQIVSRVGSLFFLETADRIKTIAVSDVSYSDHIISARLKNQGNINLVATCLYYIMNEEGVPVDRGRSETYYMPEGAAFDFSLNLSKDLPAGSYNAVLTFDLEGGISSVYELDFAVSSF